VDCRLSLDKRTLGSVSWLMAGRLGSAIFSAVATAIMARLLTPSEFGIVAAALVVTTFAAAIFESSYGLNLIRRNTTRPEDIRTTLTFGIVLSGIVCAIIILSSARVERFFGFAQLGPVLSVLALTIPLRCIYSVAASQLQIEGRFHLMARSALASTFIGSLLVGVPLGMLGFGIWALATATFVTTALESALLAWFSRLSFKPMIERQALREIWSTSIFNLATILNSLANSAFTAIIGRTLGEASLGIYSRSAKILEMFVSATAAQMARVFIPLYAQSRTDPDVGRATIRSVLEILYPVYAVASLLAVLHAPLIVAALLGGQWGEAVPVVAILFASIFPRCIAKAYENYSVANGVLRASVYRQAIYAAAVVIGALFAVQYGIVAVAASAAAALWLLYVLSMTYAVQVSGLAWRDIAILHVRLAAILIPVGVADFCVLEMLTGHSVIIAHGAAGLTGVVVFLSISIISPDAVMGATWGSRMRVARGRTLGRFREAVRRATRGPADRSA
jgi:O-antigen/teichoic acid export membrane protein